MTILWLYLNLFILCFFQMAPMQPNPITAPIQHSSIMGTGRLVWQFMICFSQSMNGNVMTVAETIIHVWGIPIVMTTCFVLWATTRYTSMLYPVIYVASSRRHVIHVCIKRQKNQLKMCYSSTFYVTFIVVL